MSDINTEEKVNKLLELIKNKGENFKSTLEEYVNNTLKNREIEKLLDEIIEEMRLYYINKGIHFEFSDNIEGSVADILTSFVKRTVYVYDAFSVVRKMDLQSANELLCGIFENCILRRDPEFLTQKDKNSKQIKKTEFQKLINGYYSLVNDIVIKLLNDDSIKKVFEVNTGIDSMLINSITQKISANFLDLKINCILNEMRNNTQDSSKMS